MALMLQRVRDLKLFAGQLLEIMLAGCTFDMVEGSCASRCARCRSQHQAQDDQAMKQYFCCAIHGCKVSPMSQWTTCLTLTELVITGTSQACQIG